MRTFALNKFKSDMEILEAIKERRSLRTFSGKLPSDEVMTRIKADISSAGGQGYRIVLIESEISPHIGTYGVIRNAPAWLALITDGSAKSTLCCAMEAEKIVLDMTAAGLGSCWLAGTFKSKDIEKAVKEAAEFEAQDKKRKEGIDAKNEADSMLFQTEKALGEVGDKIDASDRAAVEADCKALKEILEKVNMDDMTDAQIAEIKAAKEKLMGSAQKVFTKMYEQAGQAAQGADPNMGAGPNPGAGPAPEGFQGDDVVDGDYKEV